MVFFCTASFCSGARPAQENPVSSKAEVSGSRDNKDLKTDLERMRALLGLMQKNVAFVSSGDTPLKHQFQLEIEMWQLLIRDMEEKIGAEEAR